MPTYNFRLNGHNASVESWDPDQPLLYLLRNEMGLHGPKFGCGLAQCGACKVIADGKAVPSCVMSVRQAQGKSITTLEGLGTPEKPHPLQAAFIAEQAAQCGYCTNGMIVTAKALLDVTPRPTSDQIRQALGAVICRCGTHTRILRAVLRASQA
jgi:nicotinate dehydrogenase subunit A